MKRVVFSFALLVQASLMCEAQTATFSYGNTGLSAVTFNGVQYLSTGAIGVNAVNFLNGTGSLSSGSTSGVASYDTTNSRTTLSFNWGSVATSYSANANKFSFYITITNSSSQTLQSISLTPLAIQFPSTPAEFDGADPIWSMNDGNPTAIRMTAGQNTLILANDDTTQPLLAGFPGPTNGPTNTLFPIKAETTGDRLVPPFVPLINRPIAPGATDTWKLSLRFGSSSTPTKTLVSDVYQSFAQARPYRLNWPDRRPIGQLVIGTSAAGYATNPRGWFLDPSVDVTTSQGIAAFQARLLTWAAGAVKVLKSMNAQGMVTWDIEGEQYPQSTTYIGDPTQIAVLAPEMLGVVDQYFKLFTQAGLRVGICLRPQQLVFPGNGAAPVQTEVADPTQLLLSKLEYAKNRWGATLFYVDSNGDPNYPMSSRFFDAVAALHPDVLLMTEHQTDAYYSFSTPYDELKAGVTGTPQSVRDVYPAAASVIYTPNGNAAANVSALQAAVKRGDILMFRGWYPDPENVPIMGLYPANGTTPPTPVITSPANGAKVAGNITVTTSATSSVGVASVRYVLDGVELGQQFTAVPYAYSLNTATLSSGLHTLQAIATDPMGDTGFTAISFLTDSPATTPPSVSFLAPANGSTVSSKTAVSVAVTSGTNAVASVQLLLDGTILANPSAPGYQYLWDTSLAANGPHTLSAMVTDSTGSAAQAAVSLNVSNTVTIPPVISFTSPAPASTVSNTVTVVVNPQGSGALTVKISADGNLLGSVTSSPYSVSWNTASLANGSHTLSAVVTDSLGRSANVAETVTVQNQAVTDTTPPVIQLQSPQNNVTVSGTTQLTALASDNVAVAKVVFSIDSVVVGAATAAPFSVLLDTTALSGGSHYIAAQAFDGAGNQSSANASISVGNSQAPKCDAVGIRAFVGCYYSDTSLLNPVLSRLDQELNFDWGTSSPGQGVPSSSFSASWRGSFNYEGGTYSFNVVANGGFRFYVDGQLVQDSWSQSGFTNPQIQKSLTPGTHAVTMEYRTGTGNEMKLSWTRINGNIDTSVSAPPVVTMTSPLTGSTVSGKVTVAASVTATNTVTSAQLLLDGSNLATLTGPAYQYQWDSTTATNGPHTLSIAVTDSTGAVGRASASITVANTVQVAPTVSFVSPTNGATVSNLVNVTVSPQGTGALTVKISVDGSLLSTLAAAPYTFSWNTALVSNGAHTLSAVVSDGTGNTRSSTAAVSVSNTVAVAPTISFLAPVNGATVAGSVSISLNPQGTGPLTVKVTADGTVIGTLTGPPYSLQWNSLAVANGSHQLSAAVTDSTNAIGSSNVSLLVQNQTVVDTTPPTLQIQSPANNTTISGITPLTVSASDNVGISKVVFAVDGVTAGTVSTSPYTFLLDTTGMTGGSHYISAQAYDSAGNQASSNVSVSVSNAQGPSCSTSGLKAYVGCFYSDASLTTPVAARLDPDVNFDWGPNSPLSGVPASGFSASFRGNFNFDGGNYTFNLVANGGYRLFIDGQSAQDSWSQSGYSNIQVGKSVSPGTHLISIDYRSGTGNEIKLAWARQ